MKRDWNNDELVEHWALLPDEHQWIAGRTGPNRLGFTVMLKFFQIEGRFPQGHDEIPKSVIDFLAQQVSVPPEQWTEYRCDARNIKYHRARIRELMGFREPTADDSEALKRWLQEHILPHEQNRVRLKSAVLDRCRELRIELLSSDRIDRLVGSASKEYEDWYTRRLFQRLPEEARMRLGALLRPKGHTASAESLEAEGIPLHDLRADPGRATLETVEQELGKLRRIRELGLPSDLFADSSPQILETYRKRVAAEGVFELRRHPEPLRIALLAAFCHLRGRELVDTLVDLLVDMVHRIATRAESRVDHELLDGLRRVTGKNGILWQLAEASLTKPEGIVREVIFPVISEKTLQDLVREFSATGPAYRRQVQVVIRRAYSSHYRAMLILLVQALDFRSNNDLHQPVIEAMAVIRKYVDSDMRFYPDDEAPLEGVVREQWKDAVLEQDPTGHVRINKITYEICALQALRDRLRCKEVWVVGSNRYCNPDEDLPQDFDQQRNEYYKALRLTQDGQSFVDQIRQELEENLEKLNEGLPDNAHVKVLKKNGGWISLSPLPVQPEPQNLTALKAEIRQLWPMTSLLDILKETDLRENFSECFRSATAWENLDRALVRERVLLTLYGLGSNTGIKRVSAGQPGTTEKDLLYIRRRYVTKDQLREANRKVVNAIFRVRDPAIWGDVTTACASDSTKFAAWDQNLMTEWHARYGGPGVMIYWHVDRKAAAIYSQLKNCSSSEVAAMIDGVLRHCTDMSVERQYVDSHGQSEVAFAFCRLLGFDLLPRLKSIHNQRLYRPRAGEADRFDNLQAVLTRPIDWNLIGQEYDSMVKYATALRLGTAQSEDILRRFTRNNNQHPTYRALAELGKAVKTIFLCRYLRLPGLRREIHEGLNVIENWNSANDFIYFGKGGEMTSNRTDDFETSMLSLHLLQNSLVYVNTLMIQRVLGGPDWSGRLTENDLRGLTPLIWSHVSPYGAFRLDMNTRIGIDPPRREPQQESTQLSLLSDQAV